MDRAYAEAGYTQSSGQIPTGKLRPGTPDDAPWLAKAIDRLRGIADANEKLAHRVAAFNARTCAVQQPEQNGASGPQVDVNCRMAEMASLIDRLFVQSVRMAEEVESLECFS